MGVCVWVGGGAGRVSVWLWLHLRGRLGGSDVWHTGPSATRAGPWRLGGFCSVL